MRGGGAEPRLQAPCAAMARNRGERKHKQTGKEREPSAASPKALPRNKDRSGTTSSGGRKDEGRAGAQSPASRTAPKRRKVRAPLQDLVASASFQSLAVVIAAVLAFAGLYLWELNNVQEQYKFDQLAHENKPPSHNLAPNAKLLIG